MYQVMSGPGRGNDLCQVTRVSRREQVAGITAGAELSADPSPT